MVIFQCCSSDSWGGLEMAVLKTSIELSQTGHQVTILCKLNSRLHKQAEANNIPTAPVFRGKYNFLINIASLSNYLARHKADIVHTHLSHDLFFISPALFISGSKAKLFLTKHIASGVHKKDMLHKMVYKRLNGIIAISNYIKENVIDTCPLPPDKVHLLFPSITLPEPPDYNFNKSETRKKFKIPDGKITAGMAVRFTPGKGLEDFLHSINILKTKISVPAVFVIAGEASYREHIYADSIYKLCNDLNLRDDVIFTGFVENIYELFSIFDIFVFPSHNESFGVALTEAMAMELPVIAANNAGIPDIVVDNETGILIPPKNPDKLADALILLLQDSSLRLKLGKAGRKRAEEFFNTAKSIRELEKLYNG
jgi:glycosyltransferase involved in cell wall biosynthesis